MVQVVGWVLGVGVANPHAGWLRGCGCEKRCYYGRWAGLAPERGRRLTCAGSTRAASLHVCALRASCVWLCCCVV